MKSKARLQLTVIAYLPDCLLRVLRLCHICGSSRRGFDDGEREEDAEGADATMLLSTAKVGADELVELDVPLGWQIPSWKMWILPVRYI
ncbi:hypothetical protein BDZ97DRAFT_1797804 [Flammula alnicola]|nr:hypothetical protein BDZ97DRAFT_1797804 [Flammula alnicola]